jgi:hypothetical protein
VEAFSGVLVGIIHRGLGENTRLTQYSSQLLHKSPPSKTQRLAQMVSTGVFYQQKLVFYSMLRFHQRYKNLIFIAPEHTTSALLFTS